MKKLLKEQIDATETNKSIWLSANAGTGKTFVLVNRLLRLLIDGNEPHRIICITYTKAAAAEMQNRVIDILSNLVLLDDLEIKKLFEKRFEEKLDIKNVVKFRKKIACLIDQPEQLKIQTIHSFCQMILKSFPLEANIPPFFNVIDDLNKDKLLEDAWNILLTDDYKNCQEAFAILLSRFNINRVKFIVKNLINEREKLLHSSKGDVEDYILKIKSTLNIDKKPVLELENEFFDSSLEFLSKLANILPDGLDTQKKHFKNLINYFQTKRIFDLATVFLNENMEPKNILNKELKSAYPLIEAKIKPFGDNVREILNKIKDIELFENTSSVLRIFFALHKNFEELKTQKYLLDYDDLINKTAKLLNSNNPYSQWVLYKLDGGIDHILLDEAQDTSPEQWKVIDALSSEFFSGSGKAENHRSLFVVGDEKQSIFSFQGANIKHFKNKKEYFKEISLHINETKFETISLNKSFRSCKAIIDVVDKVLNNEKVFKSVSTEDKKIPHQVTRNEKFGYFEINELCGNDINYKREEAPISWRLPKDYISDVENSNKIITAQKIAERVDEILNRGFPLASTKKIPEPKDIMILLRKRDELADYIIKKLQQKNIPVSGIDRLKPRESLAIKDLLSLAKFILLESDDLNFACLLKSPIFEADEEDIFNVCWNRKGLSVFENLRVKAKENVKLKGLLDKVILLKNRLYSKISSFEFFYEIIETLGYRKNFIRYFGKQINEILDEFLNVVKKYDDAEFSSLQHFVLWFEKSDIEIKRNINSKENEVKILTIHGAKGLEAPIVIIADSSSTSTSTSAYGFDENDIFLSPVLAEYRNSYYDNILTNTKFTEEQEYYRLLYVALTRARDELYVFGYKAKKMNSVESWHNIILSEVNGICQKKDEKFIYTSNNYTSGNLAKIDFIKPDIINLEFKEYKKNEPELISPSNLYNDNSDNNTNFIRGILIHRLLEILPDIEINKRNEVANIIFKNYSQLKIEEKNEILNEVVEILNNNDLKFIFSANSRAEVPVCGLIDNRFISGKIDRLIEKEDEIIIVDFKTNRISQNNIKEICEKYKPQLKAYKVLLENIYNKKISTALLFTSTQEVIYV